MSVQPFRRSGWSAIIAVAAAVVVGAVLVLGDAPWTHADEGAEAKIQYQKATAHFAIGEYPEAAAAYEAAFKFKQDPALLYNAAQSHRLAGNGAKALLLYRNLVKLYPSSSYAADSRVHIQKLERAGVTAGNSSIGGGALAAGDAATPPPFVTVPSSAPPDAGAVGAEPPAISLALAQAGPPRSAAPAESPAVQVSSATDSTSQMGRHVYQHWWFWTAAGGVAVAAVVAAVVLSGGKSWATNPDVRGAPP